MGRYVAKKKAKPKQLPSDADRVLLLSSSGKTIPHHTGESSGNAANHAVQPQTVIQSLTTIQPSQLPTVIQQPTAIQNPYHYQSMHHTLTPWTHPSLHPPAAPNPYHLTNPTANCKNYIHFV